MIRTKTKPLDDKAMWRRLVARAHPDAGGDDDLFVWATAVKDHMCDGHSRCAEMPMRDVRRSQPAGDEPERIPFPSDTDFDDATLAALRYSRENDDVYAELLLLLRDCDSRFDKWREETRGASYRMLAAIGHIVRMDKSERSRWYRVAESIPLSDRHAGHILGRLKRLRREAA